MFENIYNLVRQEASDSIVRNPAIPNEKNDQAIQAASSSITEVFQEKASSGNYGEMAQLFKSDNPGNESIVDKIKNVFAGKLGGMGVDQTAATGAASSIIPALIAKFVNRTNDPNDKGFDLQDMLKQFGGADGKFDLNDVMDMFNKKGDQKQGGGIGDILGGFLKK